MRPVGETQRKAMRAYAQSGQYHTIVESRVRLTMIRTVYKHNIRKQNSIFFSSKSKYDI